MIFDPTIASVTLRAALGRRRALLYAIPPLILIGVSAILRLTSPADPAGSRPATRCGQASA